MNRSLPALQEALEDWRDLASDRDAADTLLHFGETRERWQRLRTHLDKLRSDPPQFDATDLAAVLEGLSSAQQMRQQIIEGNELEVLIPTLRSFLYNAEESIEEKVGEYPARVRYAGQTILAELWGWAHIEQWPLYNQSALKGLRLLGWQLPGRDYPTFARAFADLRAFYEQGEPVAPRLPLNLELDRFLAWVTSTTRPAAPPPRPMPARQRALPTVAQARRTAAAGRRAAPTPSASSARPTTPRPRRPAPGSTDRSPPRQRSA